MNRKLIFLRVMTLLMLVATLLVWGDYTVAFIVLVVLMVVFGLLGQAEYYRLRQARAEAQVNTSAS